MSRERFYFSQDRWWKKEWDCGNNGTGGNPSRNLMHCKLSVPVEVCGGGETRPDWWWLSGGGGQLTKSERVNSTKSKADGSSRPLLSRYGFMCDRQ